MRLYAQSEVNVGKSSLLNRLLGFERAIVSEEAGTTRDAIMETVDLGGLAFVITDTAGVREAASAAEAMAVAQASGVRYQTCIENVMFGCARRYSGSASAAGTRVGCTGSGT